MLKIQPVGIEGGGGGGYLPFTILAICTQWTRPDAINTSIKLTQSPVITASGRQDGHNHNKPSLSPVSRETESDSRSDSTDPTKSTDQLAKSIRREVVKLSDKWSGLLTGLEIWQRKLDDALPVSGELLHGDRAESWELT